MMLKFIVLVTIFCSTLLLASSHSFRNGNETLDCGTFDPKRIKLITFDVFAALMDLDSSLKRNIAEILPTISSTQVAALSQQWESAYGGYAGTIFDESITGSQPFQWMLRTTLPPILTNLRITVTDEQFEALISAWGKLIPWSGTTDTLTKVYNANYHIGTLSNGDQNTLKNAMTIFTEIQFSYYFSSDFPNAGTFKPDPAMYNQLPRLSGYKDEEILHVAGASSDGWGARNAGLYSALVGSPPYPKKPFPCFLLKDITELIDVLGI